jgi:hypothetical protein
LRNVARRSGHTSVLAISRDTGHDAAKRVCLQAIPDHMNAACAARPGGCSIETVRSVLLPAPGSARLT